MKRNKLLISVIIILGLSLIFYFFYPRSNRDSRLINEGNVIVKKVEEYREKNNHLPTSLSDIGIEIKDEANPPVYYDKRDSSHYTVSFGTTLGESKIYYSDSREWENFYREMK